MANSVKNIIFDLGGVLIAINPGKTIQAFRAMGMPDLIKPGGWGYHHPVFLDMEAGKLSDEQFRSGVQQLLPQPVSDEAIDAAWCAMILDYFPERIEQVKRLSAVYRVYLFSNTNAIHIRHFQEKYQRVFGHDFPELFVKNYYSNEIGLRKPDQASFEYVLNDAGLKAEETLFVDDSNANAESAKKTGMNSIWLTPDYDFSTIK